LQINIQELFWPKIIKRPFWSCREEKQNKSPEPSIPRFISLKLASSEQNRDIVIPNSHKYLKKKSQKTMNKLMDSLLCRERIIFQMSISKDDSLFKGFKMKEKEE